MITFPNAKINLGLHVLRKRQDGYHDIESCFYPIGWQEALEIIPANKLIFSSSGIKIPGDAENNLCLKAYRILRQDYPIPTVEIHLHKNIPVGAGIGGGSADAAFTLIRLNELFELGISSDQLAVYAAQIGSDCPFFIKNRPVLAYGTGTTFRDINVSLAGKWLVIVYPGIHISSREAYSSITPCEETDSIASTLEKPIETWKNPLKNDFEACVFPQYPLIRQLKQDLYKEGALYASMTGSGSAVYGIFSKEVKTEAFEQYTLWQGRLF